jgi:hypothetical protein
MRLIVIYCVLFTAGEVITFGLGLLIERALPSIAILIYMGLFFAVMWGAWLLTVEIDERWLEAANAGPSPDAVRE